MRSASRFSSLSGLPFLLIHANPSQRALDEGESGTPHQAQSCCRGAAGIQDSQQEPRTSAVGIKVAGGMDATLTHSAAQGWHTDKPALIEAHTWYTGIELGQPGGRTQLIGDLPLDRARFLE